MNAIVSADRFSFERPINDHVGRRMHSSYNSRKLSSSLCEFGVEADAYRGCMALGVGLSGLSVDSCCTEVNGLDLREELKDLRPLSNVE